MRTARARVQSVGPHPSQSRYHFAPLMNLASSCLATAPDRLMRRRVPRVPRAPSRSQSLRHASCANTRCPCARAALRRTWEGATTASAGSATIALADTAGGAACEATRAHMSAGTVPTRASASVLARSMADYEAPASNTPSPAAPVGGVGDLTSAGAADDPSSCSVRGPSANQVTHCCSPCC